MIRLVLHIKIFVCLFVYQFHRHFFVFPIKSTERNCNLSPKYCFNKLIYICILLYLNFIFMCVMKVNLEILFFITFLFSCLFCLSLFDKICCRICFWTKTLDWSLIIWIVIVSRNYWFASLSQVCEGFFLYSFSF